MSVKAAALQPHKQKIRKDLLFWSSFNLQAFQPNLG